MNQTEDGAKPIGVRSDGQDSLSSRADQAALFFIAFFMGCIAMGFMAAYMGLFPPVTGPFVAGSGISTPHAAPTPPLTGTELNQLYADVVEYRTFLYSLKFWWPILTVLGFSLAGAFVVYYVKTSIAEAKETITKYVRLDIQDDFERKVKAADSALAKASAEAASSLSEARADIESMKRNVRLELETATARTEQSLSIVCWTQAEALSAQHSDGQSPPDMLGARYKFMLEFAIIYSLRALKKLDNLTTQNRPPEDIAKHVAWRRYICANLAYYYASVYVISRSLDDYSRNALDYAAQVIDHLEKMENGQEKWAQIDNCIYAVFNCDSKHCDQKLIAGALTIYGRYRKELKEYLTRIEIEKLSNRKIADLDTFYEKNVKA